MNSDALADEDDRVDSSARSTASVRSLTLLLRRHNLNLLPILRELLRTRSVARTAEEIGLSQSAVSTALARLRQIYGDELLVMVGRRLELTERGRQLIEPTERACLEIETLLRPSAFDPAVETRRFVIAAADYITFMLAPGLAAALASRAPGVSTQFVDYGPDLETQVQRGLVDIVALPESSAGGFKETMGSASLFVDEIVVIASKAHRPFQPPLTREAYEGGRHAMFQKGPMPDTSHEARQLRAGGVRHNDVVLVEQFLTLPAIVEATDCLALVQRRLAERFNQSHGIEIHDAPFGAAPVDIRAYWPRTADRDPAHRWLRDLLAEIGRQT